MNKPSQQVEYNRIYLADKDGYLAYQFEQFHIQFKKKLEKNKRYQISIVTKPQSTEFYVDGEKIERIANPAHPRFAHNSLVLPLESIGGFKGILHSAELSDKPFVNPRLIPTEHFTVSATSQEHQEQRLKALLKKPLTMIQIPFGILNGLVILLRTLFL